MGFAKNEKGRRERSYYTLSKNVRLQGFQVSTNTNQLQIGAGFCTQPMTLRVHWPMSTAPKIQPYVTMPSAMRREAR